MKEKKGVIYMWEAKETTRFRYGNKKMAVSLIWLEN